MPHSFGGKGGGTGSGGAPPTPERLLLSTTPLAGSSGTYLVGLDTTANQWYKADGGNWAVVPSGAAATQTITQANTFAAEQIIQINSGTWALALADLSGKTGDFPVLSASATEFTIPATGGIQTMTGHSYGPAGAPILLSGTVAGGTVNTDDQTEIVHIGYVLDANTVYFNTNGLGFI